MGVNRLDSTSDIGAEVRRRGATALRFLVATGVRGVGAAKVERWIAEGDDPAPGWGPYPPPFSGLDIASIAGWGEPFLTRYQRVLGLGSVEEALVLVASGPFGLVDLGPCKLQQVVERSGLSRRGVFNLQRGLQYPPSLQALDRWVRAVTDRPDAWWLSWAARFDQAVPRPIPTKALIPLLRAGGVGGVGGVGSPS